LCRDDRRLLQVEAEQMRPAGRPADPLRHVNDQQPRIEIDIAFIIRRKRRMSMPTPLARTGELLQAAATLDPAALTRRLRPGFIAVPFEGDEPDAATMAERLVFTLEVWVAAIAGRELPEPHPDATLLERHDAVAPAFERIARSIRDRGAWDDAFIDALCEPPQSFTYGGVLSHVLAYGAVRREMLASVLRDLGAEVPSSGDPILWEAGG
jgi:AraC family transcriptional regulator